MDSATRALLRSGTILENKEWLAVDFLGLGLGPYPKG